MTKQAAKDWVESQLPELLRRFGDSVSNATYSWRDDAADFSFQARGFNFSGTFEVTDVELTLDLGIPFIARPFQGKIQSEADRWLDERLPA
jgi:hypothetical protein